MPHAAVVDGNDQAFDFLIAEWVKKLPDDPLLEIGKWVRKRGDDCLTGQEMYVMLVRLPFTHGYTLALSQIITRYYGVTVARVPSDEAMANQLANRIRRVYGMRVDKDSPTPWFLLGGAPGSPHSEDFILFLGEQPSTPTPLVSRALRLVKGDPSVTAYEKQVMEELQKRGIL